MRPFYAAKGLVLKAADVMLRALPQSRFARLRRTVALRLLSRVDGPAAAAEYARDLGVKIGRNCRIYGILPFGVEPYLIEVGDNVLISGNVSFFTHDPGIVMLARNEASNIAGHFGKIKIGNNCFIGSLSAFLPNTQIGDNCIVCAGAVVMDSFPDNCVIMGNPARVAFSTDFYRRMKLGSPQTLLSDEHPYPGFDHLPTGVRREMILNQIGNLPIRRPRLAGRLARQGGAKRV
jgi:acetyltransferase-like isoleucine patch superfamily enzyme